METIADARAPVQKSFAGMLALVDDENVMTVEALDELAWSQFLETGRAVVRLFLTQRAHRPRASAYQHEGKRWRLAEPRTDEVGTLFGKVPFERRVGRLRSSARAQADLPIDRELGLSGGFTSSVVCGMARLCTQMPFGAARQQWRSTYAWAPAPRAVMRMVDAMGERVADVVESVPAPLDDGDMLVLQVDSGGAPMINELELARRREPKRAGRKRAPSVRRGEPSLRRPVARRARSPRTRSKLIPRCSTPFGGDLTVPTRGR